MATPLQNKRSVICGGDGAIDGTSPKRFPTLAEVGNFAAMVASDRASAMTGAIANLTCGSLVD